MTPPKIDRYEIKDELGRGGMATVYLAHDPVMQRQVAIKVLPSAFLDNPALRLRFQREAETVAHLEHPHIVQVYDFGEHEGQPFLVMRLMQGGSLRDRLKNGPFSLPEAMPILNGIASALDTAHQQGIIHRDLKPDNILFDQYGTPYLADFGIVKLPGSEATLTGEQAIGTPHYVSPEQAKGNLAVDGRTDIYSLGVILFEMLTGSKPFDAETPLQIMMQHIMTPPPSITTRNPQLPPESETVIRRALAKDPTGRFQTAGELVQNLAAVSTTFRREQKRRLWLWAVGAAGGLMVLLLACGLFFRAGVLPPESVSSFLVAAQIVPPTNTATATATVTSTPTLAPTPTFTPTPTNTGTPTTKPTFTPTPTPTNTPTTTPTFTPSPTLPPSPSPTPTTAVITTDTAAQLSIIAELSIDHQLSNLFVSPDQTLALVSGSDGLHLYQLPDFNRLQQWPRATGQFTALAWNPGQPILAFADTGNVLWLWQTDQAEPIAILDATGRINSLDWSPDGRYLAAGSNDDNVRVWEQDNWATPLIFSDHQHDVLRVAWSPVDNTLLASGSADDSGRLWRITSTPALTGTEEHRLEGMGTDVTALLWSPDGRHLALFNPISRLVMWWDTASGTRLDRRINISDAAWFTDGNHIALAINRDIEVRTAEGQNAYFLRGHDSDVQSLHWSPTNPEQLLSVGRDRTLRVWNTGARALAYQLVGHGEPIDRAIWSPDGLFILSTDATSVHLWDAARGVPLTNLPGYKQLAALAWAGDNTLITLGGQDNLLRLWDVSEGQGTLLLGHYGRPENIRVLAWSPDGQWLAVLGQDHVVRIWDVAKRQVIQAIAGHGGLPVHDVAWSLDGQMLATGGSDNYLRFWQPDTGQELFVLPHESPVRALAWSHDGRFLASISSRQPQDDGRLRIWNMVSRTEVWNRNNVVRNVSDLSWSPNDTEIAVSGWAGSGGVEIRSVETGNSLDWLNLRDRTDISRLLWSPDNTRLVTASRINGAIHIWDAIFDLRSSSFAYLVENVHSGRVLGMEWLRDNATLISLGNDGALRLWRPRLDGTVGRLDETILPTAIAAGYVTSSQIPTNEKAVILAISPDGKQLAVVTTGQDVAILGITP